METLTKILEFNPILTLILGFILAVIAMILFRKEIKAYIKKKYNLFDEEQVLNLIQQSVKEDRKKQGILREFKKSKE
ncbi:MAG: hypothetical protein WBA59_03990 [Moheibacter sp.]